MKAEKLIELMQTLDDAWNAGPGSPLWETFRKRHTEDVAVYWPGGAPPTRGRHNHDVEAVEFFKTFPDKHLINPPYKILFADRHQTRSGAVLSGRRPPSRRSSRPADSAHRRSRRNACASAPVSVITSPLRYDVPLCQSFTTRRPRASPRRRERALDGHHVLGEGAEEGRVQILRRETATPATRIAKSIAVPAPKSGGSARSPGVRETKPGAPPAATKGATTRRDARGRRRGARGPRGAQRGG